MHRTTPYTRRCNECCSNGSARLIFNILVVDKADCHVLSRYTTKKATSAPPKKARPLRLLGLGIRHIDSARRSGDTRSTPKGIIHEEPKSQS